MCTVLAKRNQICVDEASTPGLHVFFLGRPLASRLRAWPAVIKPFSTQPTRFGPITLPPATARSCGPTRDCGRRRPPRRPPRPQRQPNAGAPTRGHFLDIRFFQLSHNISCRAVLVGKHLHRQTIGSVLTLKPTLRQQRGIISLS